MNLEKIFEKDQDFAGTKGLIFLGEKYVLIYQRDGNTDFYPFYLDLPGGGREDDESPFDTFKREFDEEFSLNIQPSDITYAQTHPSMKDPARIGYFIVAQLKEEVKTQIHFGNEGLNYRLVPLEKFLSDEKIIPALKSRIEEYLETLSSNESL